MSTKGKAHLYIGLRKPNSGDDYINLELADDTSGVHFLELRADPATFMRCLAGNAYLDCHYEVRGLNLLGAHAEHKTENVFMPDGPHKEQRARAIAAIAPFEVEGWGGRVSDAENWHRKVDGIEPPEGEKGHWYNVTFHRFVREDSTPIIDMDPSDPLTRQGFLDTLIQSSRRACQAAGVEYSEDVAEKIAALSWAIYGEPGPHVFAQKRQEVDRA